MALDLDPIRAAYRRQLRATEGYGAASRFTEYLDKLMQHAIGSYLGGTLTDEGEPNADAFFREYLNRMAGGANPQEIGTRAANNLAELLDAMPEAFRAKLPVDPRNPSLPPADEPNRWGANGLQRLAAIREWLGGKESDLLSTLLARPYGSWWDYTPQSVRRVADEFDDLTPAMPRFPQWSGMLMALGRRDPSIYGENWRPPSGSVARGRVRAIFG